MNQLVIHLTDSGGLDWRVVVGVGESSDLGAAARFAIDDALSHHHEEPAFPLFLDIHLAEDYEQVAPFYPGAAQKRHPGAN